MKLYEKEIFQEEDVDGEDGEERWECFNHPSFDPAWGRNPNDKGEDHYLFMEKLIRRGYPEKI